MNYTFACKRVRTGLGFLHLRNLRFYPDQACKEERQIRVLVLEHCSSFCLRSILAQEKFPSLRALYLKGAYAPSLLAQLPAKVALYFHVENGEHYEGLKRGIILSERSFSAQMSVFLPASKE